MTDKLFQGVYAALVTPRLSDGAVDVPSLRSLLAFLRTHGVSRFAANGATGEFCTTTPEHLRLLLQTIEDECGAAAEILCGVGAASLAGTMDLVRIAESASVRGLLLPMPYFFPYSQDDLHTYSVAVAKNASLPTLLYNLPQFTSGLSADTVCSLIEGNRNIVGIKDSSGSLDILAALTERLPHACRIVGNDSALAEALRTRVCDGVVSGVACALPEVVTELFGADVSAHDFPRTVQQLDDFIEHLSVFPTPWGLKWALEARKVLTPSFALPVSATRERQSSEFQAWLCNWLPAVAAAGQTERVDGADNGK